MSEITIINEPRYRVPAVIDMIKIKKICDKPEEFEIGNYNKILRPCGKCEKCKSRRIKNDL